jgi:hypothetical protein
MKTISTILPGVLFAASTLVPANAQVPGILNYQGRVTVGGTNLTTNAALFKFALVNSNGTAAFWKNDGALTTNEPTTAVPVAVTQGLYATLLGDTTLTNMAALPSGVFSNANVNLRVWFSAGGTNAYVRLAPDQRLGAAGYALRAAAADSATVTNIAGNLTVSGKLSVAGGVESTGPIVLRGAVATNAGGDSGVNLVAGFASNAVTAGVVGATVAGGGGRFAGSNLPNSASGNFATVSGGLGNRADGPSSTVGGGYSNLASGSTSTVAGGESNEATNHLATVGGGFRNWAAGYGATVAGGSAGFAAGDYATLAGGESNVVGGGWAAVGGGFSNQATEIGATVAGGALNAASTNYASIGGGYYNWASGFAATVGGGFDGFASGNYSTLAGGQSNIAFGDGSTVSGGLNNRAVSFASVPGGTRCLATNNGAFVWSGVTNVDTASTNVNSFTVRAPGGARFLSTTNTNSVGVILAGAATAWAALSDSNAKTDIEPVEPRAILRKVAEMPVTSWHYKHDLNRRYIGPMAQDFHAAFGLGSDDTSISTLDSDGVMYAAIKGLVEELKDRDAAIDELKSEVRALREQMQSNLPPSAVNPDR